MHAALRHLNQMPQFLDIFFYYDYYFLSLVSLVLLKIDEDFPLQLFALDK